MCRLRLFLFFLLLGGNWAHALDYRSVSVPVAILYDAPSTQGEKLYLVREGTPLEVVVPPLESWIKVRDAEGTIAWIERGALTLRRTAIVISNQAEVRSSANDDAPIAFTAEKGVVLDLLEDSPPGWARVRHRDGVGGFVRLGKVWGL